MASSIPRSEPVLEVERLALRTGRRRGATLVELVLVLSLTGLMIGLAVPRARRALDWRGVRAARDGLILGVERARSLALGRGAVLHVAEDPPGYWITSPQGDTLVRPIALGDVHLEVGRGTLAAVSFDAYGIGRRASRTLRVTRGGATGGVTLSAYGRLRVW